MEGNRVSNTSKKAVIYLRVSTARQASSGGEVEGYSIPAQREACRRKAAELGASVVDEYVDAGGSARSIDRPALQELLERLHERRDVDYVIVHKVDRLARDRADDVTIGLTIHKAGAVLVSASEQIDDTPAGTLLRGIRRRSPSSTPRTSAMRPRRVCTKRPAVAELRAMRRSAI